MSKTFQNFLPCGTKVLSEDEQQKVIDLLNLKNEVNEVSKRYEDQRTLVENILKDKQASGDIEKTVVLNGAEITLNDTKSYSFSDKCDVLSKDLEDATKIVDSIKNRLKTRQHVEIEQDIAEVAEVKQHISVKLVANVTFDEATQSWIATYSKKESK